jgi:hypothetical protein
VEGLAVGDYGEVMELAQDSAEEFRAAATANSSSASELLLSFLQDTFKLLAGHVLQ